jgi:hypothetical protein
LPRTNEARDDSPPWAAGSPLFDVVRWLFVEYLETIRRVIRGIGELDCPFFGELKGIDNSGLCN